MGGNLRKYSDDQIWFIIKGFQNDTPKAEILSAFRAHFDKPNFTMEQIKYVKSAYGNHPDFGVPLANALVRSSTVVPAAQTPQAKPITATGHDRADAAGTAPDSGNTPAPTGRTLARFAPTTGSTKRQRADSTTSNNNDSPNKKQKVEPEPEPLINGRPAAYYTVLEQREYSAPTPEPEHAHPPPYRRRYADDVDEFIKGDPPNGRARSPRTFLRDPVTGAYPPGCASVLALDEELRRRREGTAPAARTATPAASLLYPPNPLTSTSLTTAPTGSQAPRPAVTNHPAPPPAPNASSQPGTEAPSSTVAVDDTPYIPLVGQPYIGHFAPPDPAAPAPVTSAANMDVNSNSLSHGHPPPPAGNYTTRDNYAGFINDAHFWYGAHDGCAANAIHSHDHIGWAAFAAANQPNRYIPANLLPRWVPNALSGVFVGDNNGHQQQQQQQQQRVGVGVAAHSPAGSVPPSSNHHLTAPVAGGVEIDNSDLDQFFDFGVFDAEADTQEGGGQGRG